MIFNQLIALPRPETIEYFSTIMSGSPLMLDLKNIYVEINLSQEEMVPDMDGVYTAYADTGGIWYDSAAGISSWILPLQSAALDRRHFDVAQEAPNPFYNGYIPHLILLSPVPPLKRSYRTFMASINNTLVNDQQPLLFDAEITRQLDLKRAPMYDFYADKGQASATFS